MREECERCGRVVPSRMRGTGYCTVRCAKEQAEADRVSAELEQAEQERKGLA